MNSGMDAVKCLVKCEGGVMLFLAQSELLTLCEKVLQVNKTDIYTMASLKKFYSFRTVELFKMKRKKCEICHLFNMQC